MAGLTERQERFCREYLTSGNATDAYRKAYGQKSDGTAAAHASRMVRNGKIAGRLAKLRAEQEKRMEITADWVLEGLKKEATREGEGASHAARVSAYKTIAQIKGMIVAKNEHTGKDGGPIEYIEIAGEGEANGEAD